MPQAATKAAPTLQPDRSARSGRGSSAKVATPVKSPPLKKRNASIEDIYDAIERVHDCVHEASKESSRQFDGLHRRVDGVADGLGKVGERVAYMEGVQATQSRALGVAPPALDDHDGPVEKGFRTLATMKPWQALVGGIGGLSVFVVGYRIVVSIAPDTWAFLKSLHHILMTVATS
ncbi:hypothetical protein [Phenylobacterium ferrooxidans]|uniref:Uncharacterized protein n=1 Tax=Phenylobacterium ferrooxidans TaxID=2982689 RepID=A0ABW6CQZ7_9CAUL